MPKTSPLGSAEMKAQVQAYHAAQERSKTDDPSIQKQLAHLKVEVHATHQHMAKMLGMTPETWKYRRTHPESFKLSEIRVVQELARLYNTEVTFS